MKTFLKKISVACAILLAALCTTSVLLAPTAYADNNQTKSQSSDGCTYFLGLTSWNCKVDLEAINSEERLRDNIFTIAGNILTDLTVIAAYLVLGFVVYGGYQYILSNGDAGKVANGKNTLTHAFIGLAIVLLTNVILNAIRIALIGNGKLDTNHDANEIFNNALGWFIGISGVVAAIFLVIGGIGYVTSDGDAGKVQKAKQTILYALIGLAIVGTASIITAFITGKINEAKGDAFINDQIIIAKELHEN